MCMEYMRLFWSLAPWVVVFGQLHIPGLFTIAVFHSAFQDSKPYCQFGIREKGNFSYLRLTRVRVGL